MKTRKAVKDFETKIRKGFNTKIHQKEAKTMQNNSTTEFTTFEITQEQNFAY